MPIGSIVLLVGIACVVAAIIGGGIKLNMPHGPFGDVPPIRSVWRQLLLGTFGVALIAGGVITNLNLPISVWFSATPSAMPPSNASTPDQGEPTASNSSDNGKPDPGEPNIKPYQTPIASVCSLFQSDSPSNWRAKYLHSPDAGTWHVFVYSFPIDADQSEVENTLNEWRSKFAQQGLDFDSINTQNASSGQNLRPGLIIASGLDEKTAKNIANFSKKCGVATDAYAVYMVR